MSTVLKSKVLWRQKVFLAFHLAGKSDWNWHGALPHFEWMNIQMSHWRNANLFDYRVQFQIPWGYFIIYSMYMHYLSKIQKILNSKIEIELKIWLRNCRPVLLLFHFLFFFSLFDLLKKKNTVRRELSDSFKLSHSSSVVGLALGAGRQVMPFNSRSRALLLPTQPPFLKSLLFDRLTQSQGLIEVWTERDEFVTTPSRIHWSLWS